MEASWLKKEEGRGAFRDLTLRKTTEHTLRSPFQQRTWDCVSVANPGLLSLRRVGGGKSSGPLGANYKKKAHFPHFTELPRL